MLYRYAIDFIRNKIQFALGNQLNDDPYISILPNVSLENQIESSSYVQFILICTSKESHLMNILYLLMIKIFGLMFTLYLLKNNLLII